MPCLIEVGRLLRLSLDEYSGKKVMVQARIQELHHKRPGTHDSGDDNQHKLNA